MPAARRPRSPARWSRPRALLLPLDNWREVRSLHVLSILRIVVGLLYMEHGLAKIVGFPLQPNHAPYALFTLNPGFQGLLELVGGLLLALGLFTRTVAV